MNYRNKVVKNKIVTLDGEWKETSAQQISEKGGSTSAVKTCEQVGSL